MKRLHFLYTHENSTGYGRMGVQLAREFSAQGIDVLERLREADKEKAPAALWANLPSNARGWWTGQYRGILTMWEGSHLPETLREGMGNFDQLFVPSIENLELYSQYHPDVTYVPLGVDPEMWYYQTRLAPRREFKFLADGRGVRKGTDVAARAFKAAFPRGQKRDPHPVLMLKGSWGTRLVNSDIKICASRLSDDAEVSLYASAHCYIGASRGEGWGLQPLQAMAQGCPTILTNAHGHAAFADLGFPLSAKKVRIEATEGDFFLYGQPGDWWEPDFDQLVELMRWVYDHYATACATAHLGSDAVLRRFTWARSAEQLLAAMNVDLEAERELGPWQSAVNRLYPVVVRLPLWLQVAGEAFNFTPGKLYYERAEIKRMAFEQGVLDPACLEADGADNGLLPTQCERIKAVTAAHEACPTCGQQLNSKPLHEYDDIESSPL